MYDFQFSLPTEIHFGRDVIPLAGPLMAPLARHVLLLYGSERIFRDGLGQQLTGSLEAAGCRVRPLGGVKPNADAALIRRAISVVRAENIDGILAVGGGSVIDSAKAISAGSAYAGDVMQLYTDPAAAPASYLPIGVVVTIPATASESNPVSVISDEASGKKVAKPFPGTIPRFALLDPSLTLSVSPYQTACGGFDMLAHAFERYMDLRRDSLLLDALTEGLMRTVVAVLPQVIRRPDDLSLRSELMWAASVAHNDMLGPGGDFACHEMSHFITERFGIVHGGALAMIIPAWCRTIGLRKPARLAQFFRRVFGAGSSWADQDDTSAIAEGQAALEAFIRSIGLPLTLAEAGLVGRQEDIPALAVSTLDGRTAIGGGFCEVGAADIEAVYRQFICG